MIDRCHVTSDDSLVDHDRVNDLIDDACPDPIRIEFDVGSGIRHVSFDRCLGSITIEEVSFDRRRVSSDACFY